MLPLNRNYLKFQFSHFSQTLFQVFTHWTSFPSSIPSIQRPWAFYRQQDIQAKPLRLHSQSSHQGCILCLNRSAHWPDMFTLVSPAKWPRSNLAVLVLNISLRSGQQKGALCEVLPAGRLLWWNRLSHCYSVLTKSQSLFMVGNMPLSCLFHLSIH